MYIEITMNAKEKLFIKQIEEIIKMYTKYVSSLKDGSPVLKKKSFKYVKGDILSNVLISRIMNTIVRITGKESEYYKQAIEILNNTEINRPLERLYRLISVLVGLHEDLKAGYLKSLSELIHADVFSDYIEMAEYLLEEGYKDPAAVITGSTLEEHLRKSCIKNGIDIGVIAGGKTRPKKADTLNSELAKQNVYSKLEQKNVTAWLDLRNKAAHGHYNEYDDNQVKQMISGVRDFILRNPA